jgi:hypothetical protein
MDSVRHHLRNDALGNPGATSNAEREPEPGTDYQLLATSYWLAL